MSEDDKSVGHEETYTDQPSNKTRVAQEQLKALLTRRGGSPDPGFDVVGGK